MKIYIGKIFSLFDNEEIIDSARLTIDYSSKNIEIEFTYNSEHQFDKNIPFIYGMFNSIGRVTLINNQSIHYSSGAGAIVQKYQSEYLFNGVYLENPNTIFYESVRFIMPGLLHWTKRYSIEHLKKGLEINKPENIELLKSNEYLIEIYSSSNFSFKREENETKYSESIGVKITALKNDINIWKYLELIRKIKKFFYLIANIETKINSVEFLDPKLEYPVNIHWKGSLTIGEPKMSTPKAEFIEIQNNLNTLLFNWLENSELDTSVDLILEKTTNNELSRENYFLNNCFSIETFHRRFKNFRLFEKEEFKQIKNEILNSIENAVVKKLIENNLPHINEPNFKRRLSDFEIDFSLLLMDKWNVSEYITKIVKTRNYLVHRGNPKNIFDDFDILYSAIFIEALVKINIFKVLGMENNLTDKLLNQTGERIIGFYELNRRLKLNKAPNNVYKK